jgi:plasmid maintenance system antidote protein VapI
MARTGLTAKTINQIVRRKEPITAETAILFERVTGVPARMRNNLESKLSIGTNRLWTSPMTSKSRWNSS